MSEFYEMMTAGEIIKQIISDYEVREEEPGVYTHTFTPSQPKRDQGATVGQVSGKISLEDINLWLDAMFANARSNPGTLLVSVEDMWRVRFAWLYGQHRLPKRKLRKCVMCKRQAKINQGRRHLERRRQSEQRTWQASHHEMVDAIYGKSRIEKLVEEVER